MFDPLSLLLIGVYPLAKASVRGLKQRSKKKLLERNKPLIVHAENLYNLQSSNDNEQNYLPLDDMIRLAVMLNMYEKIAAALAGDPEEQLPFVFTDLFYDKRPGILFKPYVSLVFVVLHEMRQLEKCNQEALADAYGTKKTRFFRKVSIRRIFKGEDVDPTADYIVTRGRIKAQQAEVKKLISAIEMFLKNTEHFLRSSLIKVTSTHGAIRYRDTIFIGAERLWASAQILVEASNLVGKIDDEDRFSSAMLKKIEEMLPTLLMQGSSTGHFYEVVLAKGGAREVLASRNLLPDHNNDPVEIQVSDERIQNPSQPIPRLSSGRRRSPVMSPAQELSLATPALEDRDPAIVELTEDDVTPDNEAAQLAGAQGTTLN